MALQIAFSKYGMEFPEAYVEIVNFSEEYKNDTASFTIEIFSNEEACKNKSESLTKLSYSLTRSDIKELKQAEDVDVRDVLYRWLKINGYGV